MTRFCNPARIADPGVTNTTPLEPHWAKRNIDDLGLNAEVVVSGNIATVTTTYPEQYANSCFGFACAMLEAMGAKKIECAKKMFGYAGELTGYEATLVF